jgi:hypothetical protein
LLGPTISFLQQYNLKDIRFGYLNKKPIGISAAATKIFPFVVITPIKYSD